MKAEEFLKRKGIHPTEPIYWDTGDGFIHLNELLEEYENTRPVDKGVSDEVTTKTINEELRQHYELSTWDEFVEVLRIWIADKFCSKLSSHPTPKPQEEAIRIAQHVLNSGEVKVKPNPDEYKEMGEYCHDLEKYCEELEEDIFVQRKLGRVDALKELTEDKPQERVKEGSIVIEKWKFNEIWNAIRLTHRIYKCHTKETAFDRNVVKAWEFANEAKATELTKED